MTGLSKGFTDTIDDAIANTKWDDHDDTIAKARGSYTGFLKSTPGYVQPDAKIIRAMVWTESGGPSSAAWSTKPMQIGVPGDPGLDALLGATDHGDLILPPAFKLSLTKATVKSNAANNIQAGLGYLLLRHASFKFVSVQDAGSASPYTVKPGDTLGKIAKALGSTVAQLEADNPKAKKSLHPKDVLSVQPAHMEWQIDGWTAVTAKSAAAKYNGGGDANYAAKLDYCIVTMGKLKR